MRRKLATIILSLLFLFLVSCNNAESNITCPYCAAMIATDSKFCAHCGSSILSSGEEPVDYTILDSGDCSQSVCWEIRSNGELCIFGNGTTPDYETFDYNGTIAPWRASAVFSEITDVIISDGINGIGKNAFYKMNVSSINFGHSVITFRSDSPNSIYAENVYIPSSMKDVYYFFCELSNLDLNVYYEGTEDEWDRKISAFLFSNNVSYNLYCDYSY